MIRYNPLHDLLSFSLLFSDLAPGAFSSLLPAFVVHSVHELSDEPSHFYCGRDPLCVYLRLLRERFAADYQIKPRR